MNTALYRSDWTAATAKIVLLLGLWATAEVVAPMTPSTSAQQATVPPGIDGCYGGPDPVAAALLTARTPVPPATDPVRSMDTAASAAATYLRLSFTPRDAPGRTQAVNRALAPMATPRARRLMLRNHQGASGDARLDMTHSTIVLRDAQREDDLAFGISVELAIRTFRHHGVRHIERVRTILPITITNAGGRWLVQDTTSTDAPTPQIARTLTNTAHCTP